jgi:small multidrug resistance pump
VKPLHSILLVILLAIVVAAGDYFLKLATLEKRIIVNKWFLAGCLIYAVSAWGWVYVMQYIKLSSLGMIFSLSTVLLLTGLGVLVFDENLNRYELAGMGFGLVALVLLARFSG